MIEDPNFRNHHQRHAGSDADDLLPVELEGLAASLAADGAMWRSRLPDAASAAERIRAIPHESPLAFSEGGLPVSTETNPDSPTEPLRRQGVSPRAPLTGDRQQPPMRPRSGARGGILALIAAVVVVALFASVVVALANRQGSTGGHPPLPVPTQTQTQPTPVATNAPVALQVTSVTMAVAPASIAGIACGTNLTVTYTATIHVVANSGGGIVQFSYTVNNGRGQTPASVTFDPGATTQTYAFTWSGSLPADHTYPGQGGIQVTSPNQLTSPLVAPAGQCTPAPAPACGPNFSGQPYQSTLTTDFGIVPLPPQSRAVHDDASGGQRGFDICSAGTAATVSAYMEQNLPSYGWTLVSNSGGVETWKNSNGTITWRVSDPLAWIVYWRVPIS